MKNSEKYGMSFLTMKNVVENMRQKKNTLTAYKRVKAELKELKDRMIKLYDFLNSTKSDELSVYHRHLLRRQYFIMGNYADVLGDRLSDMDQHGN